MKKTQMPGRDDLEERELKQKIRNILDSVYKGAQYTALGEYEGGIEFTTITEGVEEIYKLIK